MNQAPALVQGQAPVADPTAPGIFIVEDELVVAKDIQRTLLNLGYRVLGHARSGTAALLKAAQLKPDLILMDIGLPGGVDGVVTAAAIRDKTSIPVVFLTGLLDRETLKRAGGSDPFGYLLKPFKPAELQAAIEIALRRFRQETSARAREHLLLTTLHAIGDGLIITNEREEISFLNPVAEQLTGWSLGDAVGRKLEEVLALRDEISGEPVTFVHESLRQRCVSRSATGTLLVGRGRTTAVDSSWAPVFDDEAKPLGVVVVFRDASEQQRLESLLRGYQKMEVVGQLTSAIAHDFNNVLSAILLCSRFLAGTFDKDDPRRLEAEEIEKSGNRGAALTRQLLTFGKRKALEPAQLNLNEVLSELDHMLRLLSGHVELTFQVATDLGLVMVDRGQIERVLVNLTINARDSMPNGGTLQIATSNVVLEPKDVHGFKNLRSGRHVMLTLTDSGCGMDTETQSHAFEPFFSTKRHAKGSGLGLSSSYEIITQNGGDIGLASEVGRGTKFTLYLPRCEGRRNSYTRELSACAGATEPETILLIEHDTFLRTAVARTLELCGYQVLRASDQADASAVLDSHEGPIHLLLSDVPISRADELQQASKLELRCAGAPLLLMSDCAGGVQGVNPGEAPLNTIQRPFVSDALARKVRTMLDSEPPAGRPREG